MKLTADISLYPLDAEYIPIIKAFIRHLRDHDDLTVVTNAMSTQVCGDYERVFEIIGAELRNSYSRSGKQVLVCKFIVGDLAIADTPDV